MNTFKLILRHKIDLILLGLSIWGVVVGAIENVSTLTTGMLLINVGYLTNSIRYKVWLLNNGLEEFLKEKNEQAIQTKV
ncbi:hypothetical protein [Mesomycoplasma ovipneumoniae]|uniref:hypothetical protein n=1 Tax=Mesomycoplasma ovipneumoniae TaxID=29562 RepID=UPI003080BF9B